VTRPRPFLAAALLAAVSAPAGAAVICVNPGVASCRATIQAAVNAAAAGDTITIAPGTYFENVTVAGGKEGLKIRGAGASTIVDPDLPGSGQAFMIRSDRVSLKSLAIRNGFDNVVFVQANNVVLQGLKIVGVRGGGSGIVVGSGFTGQQILSNDVRGVSGFGIDLAGGNDNSIVKLNTVSQCQSGIVARGNALQVSGNRVQVVSQGIVVTGGTATLAANVVEQTELALQATGANPVIQGNRVASGYFGIAVECVTCTGGSAGANVVSGTALGLGASSDGSGFVVTGNRLTDVPVPLVLMGAHVQATLNTLSGGTQQTPCLYAAGNAHTVTRNLVTRCGGAAFASYGNDNAFDFNVSNHGNAFGFKIDGNAGAYSGASLTNNRALDTNGQGFGILNGAVGTTLTGNAGLKNRLDACNTTGSGFGLGNTFAVTSTTCDVGVPVPPQSRAAGGDYR
jgi:hypothetical protein